MLRISKLADYATMVMVYLARRAAAGASGCYNARDIAEHIHVGTPTVSKLLKLLANAQLLRSTRGAHGGYQLANPAKTISVGDIIIAVDGAAGLTECSVRDGLCSLQSVCKTRGNWQLLSRAIEGALKNVNLADFACEQLRAEHVDVSTIEHLGVTHDQDYA